MKVKILLVMFVAMFSLSNLFGNVQKQQALYALHLAYSALKKKESVITEFKKGLEKKFGMMVVPVLRQGYISGWPQGVVLPGLDLTWDIVAKGDVMNCGYHALKNSLFLMAALNTKNSIYYTWLQEKKPFFDCMFIWAPLVRTHRLELVKSTEAALNADKNNVDKKKVHDDAVRRAVFVNYLQGDEIDLLLSQINIKKLDVKLKPELKWERFPVVVMEYSSTAPYPYTETMVDTVYNFKIDVNQQSLGIVWSESGHWVSFVLYRDHRVNVFDNPAALQVYYMDSCAGYYGMLNASRLIFMDEAWYASKKSTFVSVTPTDFDQVIVSLEGYRDSMAQKLVDIRSMKLNDTEKKEKRHKYVGEFIDFLFTSRAYNKNVDAIKNDGSLQIILRTIQDGMVRDFIHDDRDLQNQLEQALRRYRP